uniref:HTH psq-type domain-containing protein n=1 Tax=Ditylenchus dipsaci TaxID=166011 RepID=A0A915D4E2_9BILA
MQRQKNNNQSQLAKQFGIPRGTLIGILNDKVAIQHAIDDGGSAKRQRMQTGQHTEMEEALVDFFLVDHRPEASLLLR